jgi:hypothetical protein
MPLTASKYQAGTMLGVSDEIVDGMLVNRVLDRIPDIWCVRITVVSLAACLKLPIEVVIKELKELPERPPKDVKSDEERGLIQLKLRFDPVITSPVTPQAPQHHRRAWPKAKVAKSAKSPSGQAS